MEGLFNSRYGRVEYMNEDNVVLLSWKENKFIRTIELIQN